jgi:hypothetical protein
MRINSSFFLILLLQEHDLEEADRFDTGNLATVLDEIGVPYNEQSLIEMKFLMDPFQYHYIDIRGFALYMRNLGEKAAQLLSDLTHIRKALVESAHSSSGKMPFVSPQKGVVKITVVEAFAPEGSDSKATRLCAMSQRKVKRVIEAAHQSTSSLQMLTCALEGSVFYVEEAKMIFTHLFAILDDPVAAVAMLLPHMAGPYDANLLIKCCLGYDMKKIRRLQQKIGPIFNTITGRLGGFYMIDFADPLSRQCWKSLLSRSLEIRAHRRFDSFGELSQHGDGIYCFRNIHIVKPFVLTPPVPAASAAAAGASGKQWEVPIGLDAEREALLAPLMDVSTIPKFGKIEFDFVNSSPVDIAHAASHVHTLSDDSFIRVRMHSFSYHFFCVIEAFVLCFT